MARLCAVLRTAAVRKHAGEARQRRVYNKGGLLYVLTVYAAVSWAPRVRRPRVVTLVLSFPVSEILQVS